MQHILHIEDNPGDARLVQAYLADNNHFTITQIKRLSELSDLKDTLCFNAILLDLSLPDSRGLDTFHTVYSHFPHLPIIVMSGNDDEPLSIAAVKAGAQDYLVKQHVNTHTLIRTISHAIERNRLSVALNEVQKRQHYLATHDSLTDLPNRQLLDDRLSQTFERSKRYNQQFAVLFLDLNGFKCVNDRYGHIYGDALLKATANRIKIGVRDMDTVARLGGDEFTIILTGISNAKAAATIAKNILATLEKPFTIEDKTLSINASIGIAVYPDDGDNIEVLLHHADMAMYQAKQNREGYQFFTPKKNTQAYKQLSLVSSLQYAIERDEFYLYYQPQINVSTGKPIAVEALLRWQHPQFGLLSPIEFLSLAEQTDLIVPISEWVIFHACRQLHQWQEQGLQNIRMAINLSSRQFEQPNFSQRLTDLLAQSNVKPYDIDIELTESVLMRNPQDAARILSELRALGMTIAIDDFGTGYSSLNYLKRFPVSTLKIDRSFVSSIAVSESDACITKAILALADSLHLHTIAEGIESQAQKTILQQQGCHIMQGHLFTPPIRADDCATYLKEQIT